jgi:hypothetical protein
MYGFNVSIQDESLVNRCETESFPLWDKARILFFLGAISLSFWGVGSEFVVSALGAPDRPFTRHIKFEELSNCGMELATGMQTPPPVSMLREDDDQLVERIMAQSKVDDLETVPHPKMHNLHPTVSPSAKGCTLLSVQQYHAMASLKIAVFG